MSKNPKDLEEFHQRFPNSAHTPDAKSRAEQLRIAEANAWSRVSISDSAAGYDRFGLEFPWSDHQQRASQAASVLRAEETARAVATEIRTAEERRLKEAQRAEEERKRLESRTPPPSPEARLQHAEFVARLTAPISTRTSKEGDFFVALVESPSDYSGSVITGRITRLKAPEKGLRKGKAEILFRLDTLTINGKSRSVVADVKTDR